MTDTKSLSKDKCLILFFSGRLYTCKFVHCITHCLWNEMIKVNYAGFLQCRLNWPDVEDRLACLLWDQSQLFLPYFFDVFQLAHYLLFIRHGGLWNCETSVGIRKEVKVVADIPLIRKTIEMLTSCGQQQHGADYISHNPQRGLKGECSIKNTQAFVGHLWYSL